MIETEAFASAPWRDIPVDALGPANAVPTMLNEEERQLYFWITREMAGAEGAIVDLGCFAGGSTACLAEGNRQGGGSAQLYAYDQFTASEKVKARQLYPKGIAPFKGRNIEPLVRELLSPWAPHVTLCRGRIEEQAWENGPISILVLDASKSTDTMDRMAETFFPHLVPGLSLVVQQDELHWKEPWIAAQMQRMAEWFEPLCFVPGNMVVYRLMKPIDAAALEAGRTEGMTDEALIAALEASKARLPLPVVEERLSRQIEAVRLNPGLRFSPSFKNRPKR
ncbi:MAG: hypothetical protein RIG84_03890 [Roseovarius sp.]